jgi:Protein of unknown function (DUF3288)
MTNDQQHPQYKRDRQILNTLLEQGETEYNLAELARLRIRYQDFPGARDIQADLEKLLHQWGLTEAELFAKTRQIHAKKIYNVSRNKREEEDWS